MVEPAGPASADVCSVEVSAATTSVGAGYLSGQYGRSLAALGTPQRLRRCGAWLVQRPVAGSTMRDAIAGYRRLICSDWTELGADLEDLRDLVSVTAVTDAFSPLSRRQLCAAFPDFLRPYKRHYVVDFDSRPRLPHGHRYRLRQASRSVTVTMTESPHRYASEMSVLNAHLADRHGLHDDPQVSRRFVESQLSVPGAIANLAMLDGQAVSMTVWYVMGPLAYYHLAASSPAGYAVSANYALVAAALDFLRSIGVERVDLGSNAGPLGSSDGLAAFKRGWSTTTTVARLGGRIVDRDEYQRLVRQSVRPDDSRRFFPPYRSWRD